MKHWHKILAVALLISAAGLTGCETKTKTNSQPEVKAETAPISETALPVVLPENADVILKEGNVKTFYLCSLLQEEIASLNLLL